MNRFRAAVGLGSNLGDRLGTLQSAALAIAELGSVIAVSRVYETIAVGPEQPDYLNAALLLETSLEPVLLLNALLGIEAAAGRVRRERWGPRTLDLDVLWIDGVIVETDRLTVPHARLHERAFALIPFFEVAPAAIDPRTRLPFPPPPNREGIRLTSFSLRRA